MLARLLLSSSLLAPPAAAAETPAFTAPGSWLHGVWSDGDGLLATLEYGTLHLSCRTGERTSLERVYGLRGVDGAWIDGSPVVVAVAEDGTLVRWRAGAWAIVKVPRLADDKLFAVKLDARGRVVVAGETGAVYRLDGERWQVLAYPEAMQAVALTGRADGSFMVLGAGGELARGEPDGERLARILVPGLPEEPEVAWLGAGGDLWIAGRDELVRIAGDRWQVSWRIRHGLFGKMRVMAGVATPAGEMLLFGAQSQFAAAVGKRVRRLELGVTFPEGLAVDLRDASLLVASRDGLTTLPDAGLLAASERPRGPAPACPLPPGQSVQRPEDLIKPVPKASTPVTPAAPATPAAPSAAEARPAHKELKDRARPTLRIGFGGAFAPRVPAVEGASRTLAGFTLDVAAGAIVPVRKHVYLWPELGYNFTMREGKGGHFLTAGLAPMFGQRLAMIGLAPRLVTGDAWGSTAVGLRSGVVGSFGRNILSFEVGHQWLRAGGRDLHEGRFMISVDLTTLFLGFAVVGIARALMR